MKQKLKVLFMIFFTIFMIVVFSSETYSFYFEEIIGSKIESIDKIKIKDASDFLDKESFIDEKTNFLYYEVFSFGIKDLLVYEAYDFNGEKLFEYIRTNKDNIIGIKIGQKTIYYEEYF